MRHPGCNPVGILCLAWWLLPCWRQSRQTHNCPSRIGCWKAVSWLLQIESKEAGGKCYYFNDVQARQQIWSQLVHVILTANWLVWNRTERRSTSRLGKQSIASSTNPRWSGELCLGHGIWDCKAIIALGSRSHRCTIRTAFLEKNVYYPVLETFNYRIF